MALLAKKAAAGAAEQALNKLFGGTSKTGEGETGDSTATTPPASKAEVANKLINGALDLFKKKK